MSERELVWQVVNPVVVAASGAGKPSPAEWEGILSDFSKILETRPLRVLVTSAAGAPDAPQRRRLAETIRGADVKFAVLAPSVGVRAAAMAISFFVPGLSIFKPSDIDGALEHLGVTDGRRADVLKALSEVRRRVTSADVGSARARR